MLTMYHLLDYMLMPQKQVSYYPTMLTLLQEIQNEKKMNFIQNIREGFTEEAMETANLSSQGKCIREQFLESNIAYFHGISLAFIVIPRVFWDQLLHSCMSVAFIGRFQKFNMCLLLWVRESHMALEVYKSPEIIYKNLYVQIILIFLGKWDIQFFFFKKKTNSWYSMTSPR